MAEMLDSPAHAISLLKERIRPVNPADPEHVAKLIELLGSKRFAVRKKAHDELEKMGEAVTHLIKKAMKRKVNLEIDRRLKLLLQLCDAHDPTSILGMRQHRAVETLEWIGTPAARKLLSAWSTGAPDARLVVEAKEALGRLER